MLMEKTNVFPVLVRKEHGMMGHDVRCMKCEGDDFVYGKKCGVANDAVCTKKCGFSQDKYYLEQDLDGNDICAKCKTCGDNEYEVVECTTFDGDKSLKTNDTVCLTKGKAVGYPYAKAKCPECQLGRPNPDFRKPEDAYKRCQSRLQCVSDIDCPVDVRHNGKCDKNGFCEMNGKYYCGRQGSCQSEDGICSDDLYSNYYPPSMATVMMNLSHRRCFRQTNMILFHPDG